nr:5'-adenylylsulfate reductase-like 4 [Ipomoea batatas]
MEFHIFVVKGDEMSLQRALYMIHRRSHNYVVFLFYASWCPFSITFRPIFSVLSSLFPSIPHFAIEESAIKPRTLDSLITFYNGVTGVKTSTEDGISLDKIGCSTSHDGYSGSEQESCPFSWARSPENLLRQETYLMLATVFVLMRLLYALFPYIRRFAQFAYRSYNMRISSLWEHPLLYMHRGLQLFNSLKEPCKRSNLQEGAMNAKVWASKSLASVSFGEASSSRVGPSKKVPPAVLRKPNLQNDYKLRFYTVNEWVKLVVSIMPSSLKANLQLVVNLGNICRSSSVEMNVKMIGDDVDELVILVQHDEKGVNPAL